MDGSWIDSTADTQLWRAVIGTSPSTQKKMIAGDIDVKLIPRGTPAERIRAGGRGLSRVLTRTGVGTVVAEGK